MSLFLTHFKFSIACLFLAVTLCLSIPAHAAKDDYAALVERNLELREQLQALEQKYSQLENERNVLIGHVRNLQLEREDLARARKEVEAGQSRYSEFQKAIEQANEKLGLMTIERDKLREELTQMQGTQEDAQSTGKMLESEKAALEERIVRLNEQLDSVSKEKNGLEQELAGIKRVHGGSQSAIRALESDKAALEKRLEKLTEEIDIVTAEKSRAQKESAENKKAQEANQSALKAEQEESRSTITALESEKAALDKQVAELNGKLAKSRSDQKELAIERAFLRAQGSELSDRNRAVLTDSDRLKAEVQRLARANEALKDVERKWQQAKRDLDALRVDSRKAEAKNKKLENKLAQTKALKTRSQKKEEELKALQILQKEHESLIRKLTSEKFTLEARLARLEAPTGVSPAAYARRKGVLSPANKQRLDMHFNLAVTYDKTRMYKAEEREYMECLRIDSSDANVHYNLGILYDDKLNDNAKAIKHYRRFLQLRPLGEDSEQVKEWIMHAEQQQRL